MKKRGFTLIELIMVVLMIAIFAIIVGGCFGQVAGCNPTLMQTGVIKQLSPYSYIVSADDATMAEFNRQIEAKNQHVTNTSANEMKEPYFACRPTKITTKYLITTADN